MTGTLSDCELDTDGEEDEEDDDDIGDNDNNDDDVWIPKNGYSSIWVLKETLLCNMLIYPYQQVYAWSLKINHDSAIMFVF